MKKDRWFKWKIGAAASVGLALLFNEVKASSEFAKAKDDMATAKSDSPAQVQAAAPNVPTDSNNNTLPRRGGRRQQGNDRFAQSDSSNGSGGSSGSNSGSGGSGSDIQPSVPTARTHTRTTRS